MDSLEVKSQLQKLLGREPTCSRLRDGTYMADFFKYAAPAKKFIAPTEDEALKALLDYLLTQPPATPA